MREEIRNLILERFWADRKLEVTAREVALDNLEYKTSTATSERVVHDQSSKALVLGLLKPSSLSSLDASLADADTNSDDISQPTYLRLKTAVEYLLDCWTVATISRGSNNPCEDSLFSSNDESLNEDNLSFGPEDRPLGEETLPRPQKSFSRSSDQVDSNQNFAIRLPSEEQTQTVPPAAEKGWNARTGTQYSPAFSTYQSILPLLPLKSPPTLEPSKSYQWNNQDIIWGFACKKYIQICLAGSENFLWYANDGE